VFRARIAAARRSIVLTMAPALPSIRAFHAGCGVLALLVACAPPTSAQTTTAAPAPDAAATMRWGPLSLHSTLALSNLGVDTNVFNRPADSRLPSDFTLTFTPTTNLWLRMGQTWIDGTIQVDWVYFDRYESERGANSRFRMGVTRTFNRLRLNAGASRVSTRARPNFEIDARSQQLQRVLTGDVVYQMLGRTSVGLKGQHRTTTYDQDAVFLGTRLAAELNETTTSTSAIVRHVLTPLTSVGLEAGRENQRFFATSRNADSNRVLGNVILDTPALISGNLTFGYRHFVPWDRNVPTYHGPTLLAGLSYRLRGTTRIRVDAMRDLQQSFDASQPYFIQTGAVWSVQQQVAGPFDVLARLGRHRMVYRDRVGATVQISNRVDRMESVGGGMGYRFGGDKRVGFTLEYAERLSGIVARRYQGLQYGISITYER
jgi:hypothetical protein